MSEEAPRTWFVWDELRDALYQALLPESEAKRQAAGLCAEYGKGRFRAYPDKFGQARI